MNQIPPFDNIQFVQKDGYLTDSEKQNLIQLYQALKNYQRLNSVSGTSIIMDFDQNYVTTSSSLTTLTLPAVIPFGSTLAVYGYSSGGWKISQNANQNILYTNVFTTTGTGGSLSSTSQGDCVTLVCVVENLNFLVINYVGTLTPV
jgi:hypothetical protein